MWSRSDNLLHAATAFALLAAGVHLNVRAIRANHPRRWADLLTRRRRVRTYLVFSLLFLASALTIVLANLHRALVPQFGVTTSSWITAAFSLASLAIVITPSTRLLISRRRRSRRTGSSS